MRLPNDQALVIIRGHKPLKVQKFDYSRHPEACKLKPCKASSYVPRWRQTELETGKDMLSEPAPKPPAKKKTTKKKVTAPKTPKQEPKDPVTAPPESLSPDMDVSVAEVEIIAVDKDSLMA